LESRGIDSKYTRPIGQENAIKIFRDPWKIQWNYFFYKKLLLLKICLKYSVQNYFYEGVVDFLRDIRNVWPIFKF